MKCPCGVGAEASIHVPARHKGPSNAQTWHSYVGHGQCRVWSGVRRPASDFEGRSRWARCISGHRLLAFAAFQKMIWGCRTTSRLGFEQPWRATCRCQASCPTADEDKAPSSTPRYLPSLRNSASNENAGDAPSDDVPDRRRVESMHGRPQGGHHGDREHALAITTRGGTRQRTTSWVVEISGSPALIIPVRTPPTAAMATGGRQQVGYSFPSWPGSA